MGFNWVEGARFTTKIRRKRLPICGELSKKTHEATYHIYLGKLEYFTNLNSAAIWGWFPLRENSEVVIIYPDLYIRYIALGIFPYIALT